MKRMIPFLFVFFLLLIGGCTKKEEQVVKIKDEKVKVHEQIQKSCVGCHAIDQNGKPERIGYVRKTPEGWSQTIARMERLHGVKITDSERETIVKYLSKENGLAPEEVEPIQYWLANKQSYTEADPENEHVKNSCISCHAAGRFEAQRRSDEEWGNLKDFHLVMFPSIYLNNRHIDWPKEATLAIQELMKKNRLESKEWNDWKGKENSAVGKWKVVGFQGTKGFYMGDSNFTKDGDGYKEDKTIQYIKNNETLKQSANVKVYGGFMLRSQYDSNIGKLRGVFNVLQNGSIIKGDWSKVDDLGIQGEEIYYKVQTEKPEVIHTNVSVLKRGGEENIQLYGMNLKKLKIEEMKLPSGIQVLDYQALSDEQAELKISVAKDVELGEIEIKLSKGSFHNRLTVFDQINYIAITPSYGVARMGGASTMNKVSTQFVAYAYSNGKDGKKGTSDDLKLMPVDATWSLKPYPNEKETHLLEFIGNIDASGLFSPLAEGINEKREFTQENVGGTTVTARVTIDGQTFEAETHLIATVPDYVQGIY